MGGNRRGVRFSPANAAHDPYEVELCKDDSEQSYTIMVSSRDDRTVSPFQVWLVPEIIRNSASLTNLCTERDQVMPLNSGLRLSLYANYTAGVGVSASPFNRTTS